MTWRACLSPDQFIVDPVGSYLSGRSFLLWCVASNLGGTIAWGRPNEEDARLLARAWQFDRMAPPGFRSLIDLSRLRGVDISAFEIIMELGRTRVASFDPKMKRRIAVVYPRGVLATVVAGFFPLLEPKNRWRLFADDATALEWLKCDDAGTLRSSLDQLLEQTIQLPLAVRRLRSWLVNHLTSAPVDQAAKALGCSRRSLQRALEHAGSSFREELEQVRLDEAVRLLQETDRKIAVIAHDVGYSHAQLTRIVRRALGRTPAELRLKVSSAEASSDAPSLASSLADDTWPWHGELRPARSADSR